MYGRALMTRVILRAMPTAWARALRARGAAFGAAIALCGEGAQPSALGPQFPFAYASPDCAPWDGPAVQVVLTSHAVPASQTRVPPPPSLQLSLYASLPRVIGRSIRIDTGTVNDGRSGAAFWCTGSHACAAATRGSVRIDGLGADSVLRGRYDVTMPTRGRLRGGFDAEWREGPAMCG